MWLLWHKQKGFAVWLPACTIHDLNPPVVVHVIKRGNVMPISGDLY